MARAKRDKPDEPRKPETMGERIDFLLKLGGGECPYGILVYTQADFDEATNILKGLRGKGKLITVRLEEKR